MTFTEIRNELVNSLHGALGIDVILSDQASPERDVPFLIYSITTPYAPTGEFGSHYQKQTTGKDGKIYIEDQRREQPSATFSFTACSENRWADRGTHRVHLRRRRGPEHCRKGRRPPPTRSLPRPRGQGHRHRGDHQRRQPNHASSSMKRLAATAST